MQVQQEDTAVVTLEAHREVTARCAEFEIKLADCKDENIRLHHQLDQWREKTYELESTIRAIQTRSERYESILDTMCRLFEER